MPIRPSKLARTAGWTLVGLSLAGATIVALTPVTNGDNYCGRLYFDTVRNGACSSPMEVRTKVFIALAATSIVAGARLLVTARGTRILAVAALAILTVVLGLVSANRLLQPTSGAYCGSVLNRHRAHDAQIDGRCDALLRPGKRQAGLSFAAAALAGAVTAAGSRRLGPGWRLPS